MRLIKIKKKIRKILKSKELIYNLVLKDLKLQYKSSFLGFLWTLLDPLLMIAVLLLVFTKLFRYELINYPSYLLIGIFVWNYFSAATMKGLHSLSNHAGILTKTLISKNIIVISANLFNIIDFILKLIVLIAILIILKITHSWPSLINITYTTIIYIPIVIILQFILILGLSKILSLSYLYFKDVENIWGIMLHIGFFLTPIFYPASIIPENYKALIFLNPLNHLIGAYRKILIHGEPPSILSLSIIFLFSILIIVISNLIFKKFKYTISQEV